MEHNVSISQTTVVSSAPINAPNTSVTGDDTVGQVISFSRTVKEVAVAESLCSMNSGQIPAESDSQLRSNFTDQSYLNSHNLRLINKPSNWSVWQKESDTNELESIIPNVRRLVDKRKFQCPQCCGRFKRSDQAMLCLRVEGDLFE